MKQQPSKHEENIVGKALYDLIAILNEIDLDVNNKDNGNSDEIVIMRGREKIKVKL